MDEDFQRGPAAGRRTTYFWRLLGSGRGQGRLSARTFLARLLVGATLVLSCASDSFAQGDDAAATAEYQEIIARAIAESSEGRWAEARALFRSAQVTLPNARALRGIAMTSYELRDYVEVIRSFTAALHSDVRPLTPEQRAEAASIIARSAPLVGQYTTEDYPPEATFFVDNVATLLTVDRVLVLSLGRHEVEARWGDERAYGALDVQGAEHQALVLRVAPRVDPEAAMRAARDAQLAPREPAVEDDTPRERILSRAGAWSLFGGGLASTMAGTVLLAVGRRDAARVEDASAGTPWSSLADSYDHARTRTRAGFGLLSVGVVTAGIGIGLALRTDPATPARVIVGPTSARFEVSF